MDNLTKVSIFSSNQQPEILLVQSKLRKEGIEAEIDNAYMSFFSTPTANSMKLKVKLKDEEKAYTVVDHYLKNKSKFA